MRSYCDQTGQSQKRIQTLLRLPVNFGRFVTGSLGHKAICPVHLHEMYTHLLRGRATVNIQLHFVLFKHDFDV